MIYTLTILNAHYASHIKCEKKKYTTKLSCEKINTELSLF